MKILNDVLMIAANTARSKAYANALYLNNFILERTIILNNETSITKPSNGVVSWGEKNIYGVDIPDLSLDIEAYCGKICNKPEVIFTKTINSLRIEKALQDYKPKLVIYSGFGGQIVSDKLLDFGIPFLHVHSGWLPEYRGSTTIYYSLLQDFECGVSAILLDKNIDDGPIIKRRIYPPPPKGMNIDYLYDNAIRANLLIEALESWLVDGCFSDGTQQTEEDASTYYVIHPLLKHIALLALESETIQADNSK